MKKIGLFCLALVLALGALGVGYASWTDTIFIDGTVNTGSVDIEVIEYSGMWMWKLPGHTPEYYLTDNVSYQPPASPDPSVYPEGYLVAYAKAEEGASGADYIDVTFDKLFPLDGVPFEGDDGDLRYWWCADFIVHYNGTIPAIAEAEIDSIDGGTSPFLYTMADEGYITVYFYKLTGYNPETNTWTDQELIGCDDYVQLHFCDYILCEMCIIIPQHPENYSPPHTQADFMNLDGGFSAHITVEQWNEAGD
jgi:hypothetical protein